MSSISWQRSLKLTQNLLFSERSAFPSFLDTLKIPSTVAQKPLPKGIIFVDQTIQLHPFLSNAYCVPGHETGYGAIVHRGDDDNAVKLVTAVAAQQKSAAADKYKS